MRRKSAVGPTPRRRDSSRPPGRLYRFPLLPIAGVDETVVLAVPEDHVVEDADAEELAAVTEPLRDLAILCAGLGATDGCL